MEFFISLAWGLLAATCIIVELAHPGLFYFLSCALGAVAGLGAAAVGLSYEMQIGIFVVATFLSMLVLVGFVQAAMGKKAVKTNVSALKGKQGVVTQEIIPHAFGYVKVDGETWAARAQDQKNIKIGTVVEIISTKGAHIIVHTISGKDIS
jgi:membrane protein implicated in regulation of membrane protease activity